MIAQLRGKIIEAAPHKEALRVVVDVQGVGYEVLMPSGTDGQTLLGQTRLLFISESVTAFDGATTFYGFASREEKDLFLRIRENVDGMGPKKALECIDKINKSMPDFRRAVIDGDLRLLVSVFGFTKKTAEKIVFALKGEAASWSIAGAPKWAEKPASKPEEEAISGLVNLGYREDESRDAVQKAKGVLGVSASTESLLQEALRMRGVSPYDHH